MSVGYGYDLHSRGLLAEHDEVREPVKHHPASIPQICGKLTRIILDREHCTIKLIQEHLRGPGAALPIPVSGGFSFFQRSRME
jgi:hypothetical protein